MGTWTRKSWRSTKSKRPREPLEWRIVTTPRIFNFVGDEKTAGLDFSHGLENILQRSNGMQAVEQKRKM